MRMLFFNFSSLLQVKYDGLTGWIEFDNLSLRSNITVEMLELCGSELKTVGTWRYGFGSWTDRFKIERQPQPMDEKHGDENQLKGKVLKVLTALVNTNNVKSELSTDG